MPATITIAVTSRPVLGPTEPTPGKPGEAHFTLRSGFEAIATVNFADKGPFAPGWSVGWVQAVSFNNWAIYRGASPADGSVLLNVGSPATILSTVLDSEETGLPFVYPVDKPEPSLGGGSLPFAISLPNGPVAGLSHRLMMQDQPDFHRSYQVINGRTGAVNALREARVELEYCAAVALRDPAGRFTLLGGINWTIIWAQRFERAGASAPNIAATAGPGSRAQVGRVFQGAPPDPRVTAILSGPRTATYNDLFVNKPDGDRQENAGWPTWPVRR